MASTTHTIDVIINAINNTGDGLNSLTNNFDSSIKNISNITAPLSNIAKEAEKAELAITALGTVFLGFAVKEAADLTKSIKDIGTQLNRTSNEDVEEMKAKFQDFAKTSQSGFENLKDATFQAVSSIGDYDKALAVMHTSEKLAVVGQADLATATKALTDIMGAYGLANGTTAETLANSDRVAAALFTTMQLGVTDMEGLAESVGRVAATASAANVPIEMVGSAIAAITGAGVDVDESMTQIVQLFKQLLNPSDELAAALGGVSLSADGLPAVLDKLKEATGGNAEALFKLFGRVESAKAAMVLINDEAGKFKGTLDLMSNSSNNFNKAFADVARSIEGTTQILANNFRIILQEIGTPLEEGWLEILESMVKVTQGFQISIDDKAFDPVFNAFKGFEHKISKFLEDLAEVLPEALSKVDWSGLLDSLGGLGNDIGALFDGVDLTTADGLAHAIQFIVDSMESLNRVIGGIIEAWKPVIQAFFSAADSFNALDDSTKRTTGNVLGVAQVFESLKGMLTSANDALQTIANVLKLIGGINIAQSLAAIAPALAPLAASAGTIAAVAVAIGVIGTVAYKTTESVVDHIETLESLEATQKIVGEEAKRYADKLKHISETTGVTVRNQDELIKKITSGELILNKLSGQYENQAQMLARISKETGITVKSQDELNQALEKGLITYDKTTGVYSSYDKIVQDTANSTKSAALTNDSWINSVDKVASAMGLVNSKGLDLLASFTSLEAAERANADTLVDGYQAIIKYEDGMYNLYHKAIDTTKQHEELKKAVEDTTKSNVRGSEEWKRVQDAMQAATDSAREFELKAAELNEKRFEAVLTATVDLKVAEVEAQTERIKSAFESLNSGIESTGDTLSNLAESLVENLNPNNESILKNMLNQENDRRQQEFDLQKQLVEQEIKLNEYKLQKLQKGDALIRIDAGALTPHLRALMLEIFKEIQIYATEEGQNFFLEGVS